MRRSNGWYVSDRFGWNDFGWWSWKDCTLRKSEGAPIFNGVVEDRFKDMLARLEAREAKFRLSLNHDDNEFRCWWTLGLRMSSYTTSFMGGTRCGWVWHISSPVQRLRCILVDHFQSFDLVRHIPFPACLGWQPSSPGRHVKHDRIQPVNNDPAFSKASIMATSASINQSITFKGREREKQSKGANQLHRQISPSDGMGTSHPISPSMSALPNSARYTPSWH
jgi:hypothetical protein